MCSSQRPDFGADSAILRDDRAVLGDAANGTRGWSEKPADSDSTRKPYRVLLEDTWEGGERRWVRATGIGPNEAKRIAQDQYPGYTAVKAEAA